MTSRGGCASRPSRCEHLCMTQTRCQHSCLHEAPRANGLHRGAPLKGVMVHSQQARRCWQAFGSSVGSACSPSPGKDGLVSCETSELPVAELRGTVSCDKSGRAHQRVPDAPPDPEPRTQLQSTLRSQPKRQEDSGSRGARARGGSCTSLRPTPRSESASRAARSSYERSG